MSKVRNSETGDDEIFVVAPGRTVAIENKMHRPGDVVILPESEINDLLKSGFVIPGESFSPAGKPGPKIIGGNKRGATVK